METGLDTVDFIIKIASGVLSLFATAYGIVLVHYKVVEIKERRRKGQNLPSEENENPEAFSQRFPGNTTSTLLRRATKITITVIPVVLLLAVGINTFYAGEINVWGIRLGSGESPDPGANPKVLASFVEPLATERATFRRGWVICLGGTNDARNQGRGLMHPAQEALLQNLNAIDQLNLSAAQKNEVVDSLIVIRQDLIRWYDEADQAYRLPTQDYSTRDECHLFMINLTRALLNKIDPLLTKLS